MMFILWKSFMKDIFFATILMLIVIIDKKKDLWKGVNKQVNAVPAKKKSKIEMHYLSPDPLEYLFALTVSNSYMHTRYPLTVLWDEADF